MRGGEGDGLMGFPRDQIPARLLDLIETIARPGQDETVRAAEARRAILDVAEVPPTEETLRGMIYLLTRAQTGLSLVGLCLVDLALRGDAEVAGFTAEGTPRWRERRACD